MKEIKELLAITKSLKKEYGNHKRNFTLDGKLVGDIGEVLVANKYDIKLYKENEHVHDGFVKTSKKKVQIKSSFLFRSYFPTGEIPDYIICIQILPNGDFIELFNGMGQFLYDKYIIERNLKNGDKNHLYQLSGKILLEKNDEFKKLFPNERIKELKK